MNLVWKALLVKKDHLESKAQLVRKGHVASPFKALLVWMEAGVIEEKEVKRVRQDLQDLQVGMDAIRQ